MTHPTKLFLKLFTGLDNPALTFVTMRKGEPGKPMYNVRLRDALPTLVALNNTGSDVFFTVNETDGHGRRFENIVRARTIYADYDEGVPECWTVEPGLIVESSPGKAQAYWVLGGDGAAPDERWHAAERGLVWATGADKNVCDMARVLRLPGFINHKYRARPVSKLLRAENWLYNLVTIEAAYEPLPMPTERMAAGGAVPSLAEAEKRRRFELWLAAAGEPAVSSSGRMSVSRSWVFRKAAMGVRDFDLPAAIVADVLMNAKGLEDLDYKDAMQFCNDADRYASNTRGAALVRAPSTGSVQMV